MPDYVVITEHSNHEFRPLGHEDLNFHTTPNGVHVMIWQAEWSFDVDFSMQELHFVEVTFANVASDIVNNRDAEVETNGTSKKKNLRYVYVPEADTDAVSYWGAETLTYPLAYDLASRKNGQVKWDEVALIRYELQDLADILPALWNGQRCDADGGSCTPSPSCNGAFVSLCVGWGMLARWTGRRQRAGWKTGAQTDTRVVGRSPLRSSSSSSRSRSA
ncbi:MAG: hypothetical protein QF570_11850 [Myxococcota bacterium]|nr:hypothetical protein [Myxococcota bacterium]